MDTGTDIFLYTTVFLAITVVILVVYLLGKTRSEKKLSTRLVDAENRLYSLGYELSAKEKTLQQYEVQTAELNDEVKTARQNVTSLSADRKSLESRLDEREKVLNSYSTRLDETKKELAELNQKVINDQRIISELKTTVDKERESSKEKLELLNEAKEKLSQEFQNLGTRIFEDTSKKFTEQNKSNIENMLNPLREQIKDFDKKVSDVYDKESKDRVTLLKQIEHLKDLNQQISQDAINLTNALKGETRTQGAWGEVILEKVLEMSGLRKGVEYKTQDSFRSAEGKQLRPDVIINLPEGKQVIVDSKVSLSAYERYVSADDEEQKRSARNEHLISVNNHIKQLGSKSYEDIDSINSLNYVLMFIPIESAFMMAIENDKEIFRNAFDRNIILVCPSTLLATLRTIQSMWQFEYQSQNAQVIAERAGKLYDRFVEFTKHLENVGTRIEQAASAHEDAMKALSSGRSNLVGQAAGLKKLGIKNKKTLSDNIVKMSTGSEDDDTGEEDNNDDNTFTFRSGQN